MGSINLFFSKFAFSQSENPIIYDKIFKFAEYGLFLFLILSIITSIRRGDFVIIFASIGGLLSGFIIIYYVKTIYTILVAIFKFIYLIIAWIIKYLIWSWLKYIYLGLAWLWNVLIWSWLKYVEMAIKWLLKVLIWSWLKYVLSALLWVWKNWIWFWFKYVLIVIIAISLIIYYTVPILLDLLQTRAGRKGSFLSSFLIGIFAGLVMLFNHTLLIYLFIIGILIGSFGYLQSIFSKHEFNFVFHSIEIMSDAIENLLQALAEGAATE